MHSLTDTLRITKDNMGSCTWPTRRLSTLNKNDRRRRQAGKSF